MTSLSSAPAGVATPAGSAVLPVLRSFVYDCADPPSLAVFYAGLLGGEARVEDPDWCEVHLPGLPVKLAFQRAAAYTPPEWPDGRPQQAHLDLRVADLPAASARAVERGARVLGAPVREEGGAFQVHVDPQGHPFCLCIFD